MILLAWIVLGIATGFIGNAKGRSGLGWGIAGMFLGIFALIAVLVVPSKK